MLRMIPARMVKMKMAPPPANHFALPVVIHRRVPEVARMTPVRITMRARGVIRWLLLLSTLVAGCGGLSLARLIGLGDLMGLESLTVFSVFLGEVLCLAPSALCHYRPLFLSLSLVVALGSLGSSSRSVTSSPTRLGFASASTTLGTFFLSEE